MPAHVHADLMKQYYEDALETETPWERWERQTRGSNMWTNCTCTPDWTPTTQYRRKPVALCQIEGRDVFPGDKLWHIDGTQYTVRGIGLVSDEYLDFDRVSVLLTNLTWTEPARTKTVYQWAIWRPNESKWFVSDWLFSTEQEVREQVVAKEVRRLDWTALEVPA